ncbi:MAG: cellulose biosynthesis cyclic di-GMP-binding regulatory protein BcsB, partial [Limnobacter sp.]|nr:cellulose biosynthesis cyclic di-GMP-binding regulatory protein BcsB [Limnobacter sp.]
RLPSYLEAADIEGPTLAMDSSGERPHIKRLYVIGRSEAELQDAVMGLVLEGQALSGRLATIEKLQPPEPRKPYDAPRYVPTDRPVRFSELIDYASQLEVSAESPEAKVSLRLPPDLFSWAGKNVDMSLRYRYTAPSDWNDSLLTVEINDNLLQSMRLPPRREQNENRFNLNLLGQSSASNEEALKIPAFRVGGNNEIKFKFSFAEEGSRSCNGQPLQARGSIDPESTLDFSDLPHYIRMPNLAAFANGGYPFSIYADLGDTAVIVPDNPDIATYSQYLNLMGLFGQWTGIPSTRAAVIYPEEFPLHRDRNWIALGSVEDLSFLRPYELDMPMVLDKTRRSLGQTETARWLDGFWNDVSETLTPVDQGRAFVQTRGSLGAIMSFESPLAKSKTGVVVTGTDEVSFRRAMQALSDYGDIARIRGSVTLLRGTTIQSF